MNSGKDGPGRFFEQVYSDYCEAEKRAGGPVVEQIAIGPFAVRLRWAGQAMLEATLPSLAHLLAQAAGRPDLTICICDSASTGIRLREPPWATEVTRNGMMSAYCADGVSAFFQVESSTLSLLSHDRNLGVYWAPSTGSVSLGERAHPLLWLLHGAMSRAGYQFVHAAGIGDDSGGVLLAGGNGSGKSTTALACLLRGLHFAGDDFMVLEDGPKPLVHSLYSSVKLCDDVVAWFPEVEALVSNPLRAPGEKALVQLSRGSLGILSRGFDLKGILLPAPGDGEPSVLAPLSAGATLARLAPSSVLPLPGAGRTEFFRLASLARRVQGYTFKVGRDLAAAAEAVRGFLASGAG